MPQVRAEIRSTLMPTSRAAVGSWETARMAVPMRVRLKNSAAATDRIASVTMIATPWLVTRTPPRC